MEGEIVNKVEQSGLINFDLEDYYPKGERVLFDVAPHLWEGMVLKEKDFRSFVKDHDWAQYDGSFVAVACSADAIVPTWAYMLITSALDGHANKVVFGSLETLETVLFNEALRAINPDDFKDERVIVKGCGSVPIPDSAYVEIVSLLQPVAKSIMFGEACSTVPVYKKPKV